ncbi:subtilisin-like protein [Rickenella mellea]|uniref:tripeptidyl-peptidase II n=1 Tax=Rickenella mellea TaxID=50990 RepID=A0A4Y7Q028_9AGAM|nr:subtilisin-like protein [Rickenella mellea]
MVVFPVFVSAILASFVLAEPLLSPHVVHEKRARDPLGWSRTRRIDPDVILPMRFGLTQNNMDTIEDMLMDVSHPESPNYGKHWTAAKVVNHFAPSPATISAVKDWLHSEGIHSSRQRLSPSKIWVEVNASVAEVERLLKTEYHIWADNEGGERVGCHEYSIPEHMRDHIDIIKPTVHLTGRIANPSQLRKRQIKDSNHRLGSVNSGNGPKTNGQKPSTTLTLADCDQFITPVCLQALYNIHYRPLSTKRNTFGIVEFTPQAFLQPDLDMFFKNFSPSQVGQKPILVSIDGGVAQTTNTGFDFNGESDLDLEYAMALTNPQPITLLQTGDLVEGAGFDNWLDAVDASFCTFEGGDDPTQDGIYPDPLPGGFTGPESCGIIKPPHVVSISYGQDEVTITPKSAMRQCAEYAKIGMMGTTVLYSSGDNGVAGFGNVCLTSNGTEAVPPAGTRFNPTFPSGCPFVTSVGATQISPNKTVHDPESACEQVIFSGGGFSNIFGIPSYQKKAVAGFLKNHPPPYTAAQFNNSGTSRAFPDLSANGANYVVAIDGGFFLVFGTSASAPTTGSIITLINDARLTIGKGPVGFINPAIYSDLFRFAFNDITTGGNQGCGTPGFTATTGWDPVTGVGTPNFEKLLALWLLLP